MALIATSSTSVARATTVLQAAAAEPDQRVRAVVAASVDTTWFGINAKWDASGAEELLLARADHADPDIATNAIRAVTALPLPRRPAIEQILHELATAGSAEIRCAVAGGWPTTTVSLLLTLLSADADPLVRATAATSLTVALVSIDDAVHVWAALRRSAIIDPDPRVRGQIVAALGWRNPDLLPPPWPEHLRDTTARAAVALTAVQSHRLFLPERLIRSRSAWSLDPWRLIDVGQLVIDRAAHDPDMDVRALASFIQRAERWTT